MALTTKEQLIEAHSEYSEKEPMVYLAFSAPRIREPLRKRIEDDVQEYVKRGGKIHEVNSAAGGGSRTKISDQEQRIMELKIKQLRKEHGNTCNIRWEAATNKFRAFFRGSEVGFGFDDIKRSSEAITSAAKKASK